MKEKNEVISFSPSRNYKMAKGQLTGIVLGMTAKNGQIYETVKIQTYRTRAGGYHAKAYILNTETYTWNGIGYGCATGYGYDKESAAAAEAITSAGIELSQSPYARGMNSVEDAVMAILEHLEPAGINETFQISA